KGLFIMTARFRAPRGGRTRRSRSGTPSRLAAVHELPRPALRPVRPLDHLRGVSPVLVDPPPFDSPAGLAECVSRMVDELAAVIESSNGQLGPLACRVVLRGLGEAHVLLDELSTFLPTAGAGSPDIPPPGGPSPDG